MIVYHGGTDIIKQPMVQLGRNKLDFGKGYYVTDILEQAEMWSRRIADYRKLSPVVCKYKFDLEAVKENFSVFFAAIRNAPLWNRFTKFFRKTKFASMLPSVTE